MTTEEFNAGAALASTLLAVYGLARTWRFAKALMWGSE